MQDKPVKITVELPDGTVDTFEVDAIIASFTKDTQADDPKARSYIRGDLTDASMIKALSAIYTYYIGSWVEKGLTGPEIDENFKASKIRAMQQMLYWSKGVNTEKEYDKKMLEDLLDILSDDPIGPTPY